MLAIYVRVSTDEQKEAGLSIDNQIFRGKTLATKLDKEYKIYSDAGFSGELPINERPAFLQMFKDIESGLIDTVYVFNQSRLDRGDLLQFLTIISLFKKHKTKLYYDTQHQDYTNTSTELSMNVMSAVNHNHNQQLAINIKSTLEKNIIDGKASGGSLQPYGYRKTENKMLVIDDEEKEIVIRIFDLAISGKGTKAISTILNNEGVLTKRTKFADTAKGISKKVRGEIRTIFKWADTTIYGILTNTIYIGERVYGQNEDRKIYLSPQLAFIDKVTFELTQQSLRTRHNYKDTTNRHHFLLKGLLECGMCHNIYFGKKSHKDSMYMCASNRRYASCGNKGIAIDYLDNLICDTVKDLGNIINGVFDSSQFIERSKEIKERYLITTNNLKEQDRLKQRLIDLAIEGTIDKKDVKERLGNYDKSIEYLTKLKDALSKEMKIINERENLLQVSTEGVKRFNKMKSRLDRKEFLRNVIDKINVLYVEPDANYVISIYFKLNQLENYLINKEITIDRNIRAGSKKPVNKVLSEKINLIYLVVVDDANNVEPLSLEISYNDYADKYEYPKVKRIIVK